MNIGTNDNGSENYIDDPLIYIIAETLGVDCGINIDDNCSISELANLLTEIESHFHGDTASALAAIRAGDLEFEEIPCRDEKFGEWLEWHIKATRQKIEYLDESRKQLTSEQQAEFNKPQTVLPPTYYMAHGGRPTNRMEWKAQNFGAGQMYGLHGISLDELETDWPEILANPDCMRGYRQGQIDSFDLTGFEPE
jgi:hypothetical protein